MKEVIICLTIFASSNSCAGELGSALRQASRHVTGSDAWYTALTSFVERSNTNEVGKMTSRGLIALRMEVAELRKDIVSQDPPLDVVTDLNLAQQELTSHSMRNMCRFLSRWSRVCALVGRMNSDGKIRDVSLMFRCDLIELFVEQHAVRAFLPNRDWSGDNIGDSRSGLDIRHSDATDQQQPATNSPHSEGGDNTRK